jgi:hypothetical protein
VENRVHPIELNEKWTMAQVTKVRLVDDLDGTEAGESISFTLDGAALEIDLSEENAEKLRGIFAPYVAAARRGDRRPARRRQRVTTASPTPREAPRAASGQIREWAAANGFTVSARGRISSEVLQAYENRATAPPDVAGTAGKKPDLPKVADPFTVRSA